MNQTKHTSKPILIPVVSRKISVFRTFTCRHTISHVCFGLNQSRRIVRFVCCSIYRHTMTNPSSNLHLNSPYAKQFMLKMQKDMQSKRKKQLPSPVYTVGFNCPLPFTKFLISYTAAAIADTYSILFFIIAV